MKSPAISIGMPIYNEERHLEESVRSLLAQTFTDFEIILSDNGSTDGTWGISQRIAATDPRIRLTRSHRNLGASWNFNRTLELATGEFFIWAGGHDLWHPTFLERCLEPLRADPHVVLAQSLTILIDHQSRAMGVMPGWCETRGVGQIFRFNVVQWGLINGNAICGLIRRSALNRTGRCRANLGPHLILLSELAILGQFALIPDPLFCRREVRPEEDVMTKLRRWHRAIEPKQANRSVARSLAHFAWEHVAVAFRARLTLWPRILLFPSILLILVCKMGKFLQWRGHELPEQVLPGSLSMVRPWPGGPVLEARAEADRPRLDGSR